MDAIALSCRVWSCAGCGTVHGRDLHAAISIKTGAGPALYRVGPPAMKCEACKSMGGTGLQWVSLTAR